LVLEEISTRWQEVELALELVLATVGQVCGQRYC